MVNCKCIKINNQIIERRNKPMLTLFGKFCRKLRIDNGELLKEMANKLEVTSSYLSAVENGKRNVPQDWSTKIAALYSLDDEQYIELKEAVKDSQLNLKVDFKGFNKEEKNLMMALARDIKELGDDDMTKIKNILRKSKKGGNE
jgi:transcriptional regulator with XRE-family HTH domain